MLRFTAILICVLCLAGCGGSNWLFNSPFDDRNYPGTYRHQYLRHQQLMGLEYQPRPYDHSDTGNNDIIDRQNLRDRLKASNMNYGEENRQ